ncbi:MAG: hypothetical protein QOH45_241, partial [Pseudonocardiales bacterium]|nr:hypothetical protein [Pseudonocardiales bacterium]
AAALAQFYADNQTRIRLGLVVSMLGAALSFAFPVPIMLQLRRIRGGAALGYTQLVAGMVNPLLFVFPMFAMAAAAYRPDSRSPEITQALNDLGWLALVGFGGPAIVQTVVIAIAILSDHEEHPVFARWVGYFNVWCALLFVPGLLVIVFHSGPFAWNGMFAFWVPLTVFSGWFVVMAVVLFRAIKEEAREQGADDSVPVGQPQLA